MITALKVTAQIITSIGEKSNTIIKFRGLPLFPAFDFYESNVENATKILAVFKNNNQIPQLVDLTVQTGVEPSQTSFYQALKTYLETTYNWTIETIEL